MTDNKAQGTMMTLAEAFNLREQELRDEADAFDAWRAAYHRRMANADLRAAEQTSQDETDEQDDDEDDN
jgi:hypothetical protein